VKCTVYKEFCPDHNFVHGAEAEELRDQGHANRLDHCALCGVSVSMAEWETWHDEHGWGYLERKIPEPTFPIQHADSCPYKRAAELVGRGGK
jgi:hypothetical protein